MNLFGEEQQPKSGLTKPIDLETLATHDLDASFTGLAERLAKGGHLNVLVQVLIDSGRVDSVNDAITYLAEEYRKIIAEAGEIQVYSSDFGYKKHGYLFSAMRQLKERVQNPNKKPTFRDPMLRRLGIASHIVVAELMSGNFHLCDPLKHKGEAQLGFDDYWQEQAELFGPEDYAKPDVRAFHDDGSLRLEFVNELYGCWLDLATLIRSEAKWHHQLLEAWNSGRIRYLRGLLDPICDGYLERLRTTDLSEQSYYGFLTMVTWASVILHVANRLEHPVFFKEVPVVDRKQKVSGWRLDAMSVAHIDGKAPSTAENERIRQLTRRRYESSGQVSLDLQRHLSPYIGMHITDWKFAVGDGKTNQILSETDVTKPIKRHEMQVAEYLILAQLDTNFCKGQIEQAWEQVSQFEKATLIYCLPTTGPIFKEVTLDPQQKETLFTELASKWDSACANAEQRHVTKQLINRVSAAIRPTPKREYARSGRRQPSLVQVQSQPTAMMTALTSRSVANS